MKHLRSIWNLISRTASVPAQVGKKRRIQILMEILTETLAFDDPFADMPDQVEAEGEYDATYERVMTRFEIPEYPARYRP